MAHNLPPNTKTQNVLVPPRLLTSSSSSLFFLQLGERKWPQIHAALIKTESKSMRASVRMPNGFYLYQKTKAWLRFTYLGNSLPSTSCEGEKQHSRPLPLCGPTPSPRAGLCLPQPQSQFGWWGLLFGLQKQFIWQYNLCSWSYLRLVRLLSYPVNNFTQEHSNKELKMGFCHYLLHDK